MRRIFSIVYFIFSMTEPSINYILTTLAFRPSTGEIFLYLSNVGSGGVYSMTQDWTNGGILAPKLGQHNSVTFVSLCAKMLEIGGIRLWLYSPHWKNQRAGFLPHFSNNIIKIASHNLITKRDLSQEFYTFTSSCLSEAYRNYTLSWNKSPVAPYNNNQSVSLQVPSSPEGRKIETLPVT
jgi:hypothetical protein